MLIRTSDNLCEDFAFIEKKGLYYVGKVIINNYVMNFRTLK